MTLPNISVFLAADQDSMNEIEEVVVAEDCIKKRWCGRPAHCFWADFTDTVNPHMSNFVVCKHCKETVAIHRKSEYAIAHIVNRCQQFKINDENPEGLGRRRENSFVVPASSKKSRSTHQLRAPTALFLLQESKPRSALLCGRSSPLLQREIFNGIWRYISSSRDLLFRELRTTILRLRSRFSD
jgi:hypothetical protein